HFKTLSKNCMKIRFFLISSEKYISLLNLVGWEFALSVAWLLGVQLIVFFSSDISVVLSDFPGVSWCRNTFFPLSPHL
ncbi:MAG: hypothetical protein AB2693_31885, partial [Candidatus Thiodiazotropha sp.]